MLLRCIQILCPLLWFFCPFDAALYITPDHLSIYPSIIIFASITTELQALARKWTRQSIINIGFHNSNTPVLSKVLSKMALDVARLVLTWLVIPTSFDPKLNWLIKLPTGNTRLSPSVDVMMGIPIWACYLTWSCVLCAVIEKISCVVLDIQRS